MELTFCLGVRQSGSVGVRPVLFPELSRLHYTLVSIPDESQVFQEDLMVVGRGSGLSDPMFSSCRFRRRGEATLSPVTAVTTIAASVFLHQAEHYLEMNSSLSGSGSLLSLCSLFKIPFQTPPHTG